MYYLVLQKQEAIMYTTSLFPQSRAGPSRVDFNSDSGVSSVKSSKICYTADLHGDVVEHIIRI